MKTLLAFSLTFGLTVLSLNQAFAAGGEGHGSGVPHRDNTTLFPQPKPDPALATPPAATTLAEPAFQAKTDTAVTLRWEAAAGADRYHVQVATDPNFKWLVTDDHNVQGTSFDAKDLKPATKYFWRVAGWKSGNMAATNKAEFKTSVFETK